MSYEIVYSRNFIKTRRGIIPLLLSGSNNCTEWSGRGWRKERSWGLFYGNMHIEMPADELLKFFENKVPENENYDFCDFRGKRLFFNDAYDFYKTGIKKAHTVEDWLSHGRFFKYSNPSYLRCYISDWSNGNKGTIKQEQKIHTTPELEAWINCARIYIGDCKDMYICFKFDCNEPLKYNDDKPVLGRVIIACVGSRRYLKDAHTSTTNKQEAMIFDNQAEAEQFLIDNQFYGYKWNYKYIKYNPREKAQKKDCYIHISGYGYFVKFTRYGYRYSYTLCDRNKMDEKRASKVFDRLTKMFGQDREIKMAKEGVL